MRRYVWLGLIAAAVSHHSEAAWFEASSDHFVIYANQPERDIKQFADRLERYHDAMELRLGISGVRPSPSNRVTIYVLRSDWEVRKVHGNTKGNIVGFYVPRAGESAAFIPRVNSGKKNVSLSETILLHEYAHHFMFSYYSGIYPLWFSEGFAEFFAAAQFKRNGDVGVGVAANHRAADFALAKDVPLELLLDSQAYVDQRTNRHDQFYGKSWLLFHYLQFAEARQGQLTAYLRSLSSGTTEMAAARSAFGDLDVLDKELRAYLRQKRIRYLPLKAEWLTPGPIALRKLRKGEAAVMPLRIRSKRGVNRTEALDLLTKVQAVAERFPDEPAVWSALAEAEFDAGNHQAAIAAADRALGLDSADINALLQKGFAMARLASKAPDPAAAWSGVRRQFVQVNRLENDHPIPLVAYYETFKSQGGEMPERAIEALNRALELAPFDAALRLTVAQEDFANNRYADAARTLRPLANSPHKTVLTERAAELMQAAEALANAAAVGAD